MKKYLLMMILFASFAVAATPDYTRISDGDSWFAGNVGIGTDTPGSDLEVNGTAAIEENIYIGQNATIIDNLFIGDLRINSLGYLSDSGGMVFINDDFQTGEETYLGGFSDGLHIAYNGWINDMDESTTVDDSFIVREDAYIGDTDNGLYIAGNGQISDIDGYLVCDDTFQINDNLNVLGYIYNSGGYLNLNDEGTYIGGSSDGLFVNSDGYLSDIDDDISLNDNIIGTSRTPFYYAGEIQFVTHPEDPKFTVLPYLMNDIGHVDYKGGYIQLRYNGINQTSSSIGNVVDGMPQHWSTNPTTNPNVSIEIGFEKTYYWGNVIGWSAVTAFRAKDFTLEMQNTSGDWTLVDTQNDYSIGQYAYNYACGSVGCIALRFNFTEYPHATIFRVSEIFMMNYAGKLGMGYFASQVDPEFWNDVTIYQDLNVGDALVVDQDNNEVGIGLTNPSYNLHIFDTDNPTIFLSTDSTSYTTAQIIMKGRRSGTGGAINTIDFQNVESGDTVASIENWWDGSNSNGDIRFYTQNTTEDRRQVMEINSNGQLGIGFEDPTEKLMVDGNALITDNILTNTSSSALVFGGFYTYTETVGFGNITMASPDIYYNASGLWTIPYQSNNGTIFTIDNSTGFINFGTSSDGYYDIKLSLAFSSDRTGEYHCGVFVNDEETYIGFHRSIGTISQVGSASAIGFLYLEDGDEMNLRCETDSGANPSIMLDHLMFTFKKMII